MGYFGQTIKGLTWVGALRLVTRSMSFARVAILARLLTPSQFGIFGIASFFLALIEVFTETGVNIFLVQEKQKIDKYINSIWIVSIVRGIIISLVIFAFSPLVASFFKSSESLYLLHIISIVPIIRGFINPSIILFQKELTFHKEFYFRGIILVAETVITVLGVYLYRSPVALVWGLIASAALEVVLSFLFISPRPTFAFDKSYLLKVIYRGKWITVSTISNYLYQNLGDMVVARLLNTTQLGLYQMAYKISMLPITEVSDVIAKVTFPVYSKISNDVERLKKAFIKTLIMTILFSVPVVVVFLYFPDEIVYLLLGDKWLDVVPILQVLAYFGLARAFFSPASVLFLSLKRQDIVAKISILSLLILIITIVPFVARWGLVGAGLSAVFASLSALPFAYYYAWKMLK